jgi:type II secretory pathway pseudopilin PulG
MNCEQAKQSCGQVQSLLLAYLDGEVTPSERALILAHLSGCTVCQQELNLLSTARSQVRSTLQRRASQAVPSREAWSRLEARLTEAAQPSSRFTAWFSRKAPGAGHVFNQTFGGVTMQKRWILSSVVGVAVVLVLAALLVQTATPASARQILDRAYAAQTQAALTEGIEHIRNEIFSNLEAKSDGQGMDTIVESYSDPVSGNFRVVITDKETGKVLQVYAFDGSNAYTSDSMKGGQQSDVTLTVYRSPQNRPSLLGTKFASGNNRKLNAALDAEAKNMFDKMRQDPHVELVGQETWDNGHSVYVLRSQQEIKLLVENQITHPMGLVTVYFDVDTYQLLGDRVSMERDGKEVLISRQQILLDEILPAESNIAWD